MPRFPVLQSLRALAALMVLTAHVLAEAEHYLGQPLALRGLPWTRGVDVFFVLSGLIVALSAARHAGRPAEFLGRRLLRVVPLYWLFTSLMICALFLPGGAKDTGRDIGQIVSSYLFLPWERADGRIAPVLSLGWTLNYEVFFYALLAVALATRRPLVWLTAAVLGLVLAGMIAPPSTSTWRFATNPLMLEFLCGVGLSRLVPRLPPLSGSAVAALVVAGLCSLIMLDRAGLPRWIAAGLPATLIVGAGALARTGTPAPLRRLGDASFALYLSHRFALRSLTLLVLPLLPRDPLGAAAFCALAMVAALLLALVVHRGIERPLLTLLDRSANGAPA